MQIKKDHSVGIIPMYINADGTRLFCIVRHAGLPSFIRSGLTWGGHWAFPKGHRNEGESEEVATRRELQEETGIDTITLDNTRIFIEQYSFEKDGVRWDKTVNYLLGTTNTNSKTTPDAFKGEIRESRWVTYDEAQKFLTFSESKYLLDQVQAYLQESTP